MKIEILQIVLEQLCVESDTAIALKDRDGAHIPVEHLLEIIKQFKGCSCFYVEVFIYPESSTKRELIDVETAINSKVSVEIIFNLSLSQIHIMIFYLQSLEKYIKEGDYGCIFEEYSAKSTLCDRTRRNLVREATNFLRKICGNHPKRQEKIALAESLIHLFPNECTSECTKALNLI